MQVHGSQLCVATPSQSVVQHCYSIALFNVYAALTVAARQCSVFVCLAGKHSRNLTQLLYLRSTSSTLVACAAVMAWTYPLHSKGPGPRRTPNEEYIIVFYVVPVQISVIHVINSHDMLDQQKKKKNKKWPEVCQTLFPERGWSLGTRLIWKLSFINAVCHNIV